MSRRRLGSVLLMTALACGLIALLVAILTGRDAREVSFAPGQPPEVTGSSVTVYYIAHPDDTDPQAEVEETSESVTITVTVDDGCGSSCTAEGVVGDITVSLDQPVGSRAVIDGSQR